MAATSFKEQLSDEEIAYLQEVGSRPFSGQAVAFLNAYWPEVKEQAEFIYSVAWDMIKYADMHGKGIQLLYQYQEGSDLDFDMGLYFYEQLCKFLEDEKNVQWTQSPYEISQPEMMTALKRKQCLRDKVDVDFDGRISFLEYLLYEYIEVASPADFCKRSQSQGDEHPEVRAARLALEEVNDRIREYEAEKARLEALAEGTGVKALGAVNMLAQIESSPLKEALNEALIRAEAALRKAVRMFGSGGGGGGSDDGGDADGALWWMQRELAAKKAHYGR